MSELMIIPEEHFKKTLYSSLYLISHKN